MKSFEIEELNRLLEGKIKGNSNLIIKEPEHLDVATESSISFLATRTI